MSDALSGNSKLSRFKTEFLRDFRHDERWRKNKREDADFYDGNQWTDEEKQALDDRGQPAVVINRIKPKIDSIVGMQEGLRVDTKAYPKGQRDEEVEVLSEKLRAVEDDNDFDESETDVFSDQLKEGRGWYEIRKEWDGMECRHRIEHASNDEWLRDRYSRRDDLTDSRHVHNYVWMDVGIAKQMFPGHDQAIDLAVDNKLPVDTEGGTEYTKHTPDIYSGRTSAVGADDADYGTFVDKASKRIRIVKTYWRENIVERFYMARGMEKPVKFSGDKELRTLEESFPNGHEYSQTRKKLHSVVFTWSDILEEKSDIRSHDQEASFPAVMVSGYTERNSGMHYGLVRQHKDPQREVNKRRSKAMHLLNVNRLIYEQGAFDDPEEAHRQAARPDARLEYIKGFDVRIENNTELATAQFQLLQQATQEIDSAGVNRELEGRGSGDSGRAFQLRQQQAMQSIRKLFANLRSGRRRVAYYLVQDFVKEQPELAVTKYDIVIEEAPDTISLQGETFDTFASLRKDGVEVPGDMLVKMSPLPTKMKEELAARMDERQQMTAVIQQLQQQVQMLTAGQGATQPQGAVQ